MHTNTMNSLLRHGLHIINGLIEFISSNRKCEMKVKKNIYLTIYCFTKN